MSSLAFDSGFSIYIPELKPDYSTKINFCFDMFPTRDSNRRDITVNGKHKKKYINAIIGKITKGSVPETGALAQRFPISMRS